jgi:hypothetical protein
MADIVSEENIPAQEGSSNAVITDPLQSSAIEIIPIEIPTEDSRKCKYCEKTFKKQAQLDEHTLKQPCLKAQFKTNCLLCGIRMDTRAEYDRHIVGREHFNLVAGLTSRDFKWQPASKSKTKQAGFTINYENDTTESFEVAEEEHQEEQPPSTVSDSIPPMPTRDEIRKRQIINQLAKIKASSDPGATFYKLLSKLTLADYDGLYIYIARETSLSDVEKKFFIQVIIKFIRDLEAMLQSGGASTFEGKDIRQIIVNLSNKKR